MPVDYSSCWWALVVLGVLPPASGVYLLSLCSASLSDAFGLVRNRIAVLSEPPLLVLEFGLLLLLVVVVVVAVVVVVLNASVEVLARFVISC